MSRIRTLPGRLICTRDPMIESVGRILLPSNERRVAVSGLVLLHEPSRNWHEGSLTGRRIFFEKWAWKDFKVRGMQFSILPERAVLAIEERPMRRDTLVVEITKIIVNQVEEDRELTQQDIDDIGDRLRTAIDDIEGVPEDDDETTK